MDQTRNRHLPIDRGWAWVITFASCGLFGYVSGGFKSQGVILVEVQEIFPDASAQSILWIFSLTLLINRFTGPLNGFILSRTSNRFICCLGVCLMTASLAVFGYLPKIAYMYPAYGGIYGWGSGMLTLSAFTAYGPYFDKKKALSVGISSSGSGIGTILIPVLLRALFDNYSFSGAITAKTSNGGSRIKEHLLRKIGLLIRCLLAGWYTGCMLIYAATAAQMMVLACLLRPISFYERIANASRIDQSKHIEDQSTEETIDPSLPIKDTSSQDIASSISMFNEVDEGTEQTSPEERKPKKLPFNWRLAYNPRCIMLGLAMMSFTSGLSVTYYSIPPLGKSAGVSKQLVAILFVACGLLEIPCRTGNGWIADKRFVSTYTHLTTCMLITGICACLCGIISGTAGIVIVILGISSVGTSALSLLPITAGEMFGQENASGVMSIMFVYQGSGSIISTFSAGAIVEAYGRWELVFLYIGACMILGFLTMVMSAIAFHYIDRRKQLN